MNTAPGPIRAVPTNIITGFLGVGKTSAILNLLKHKPEDERWAVLVNEFGEIGVDGSLFEGQHERDQDVFIREVPGGCMCCASGLPMQIALNQLLARAQPDRLLVEPTGLGHPIEVLQVLSADHYRDVLTLQKTLTLVDARKLADPRYTQHETFNQQISIADIVIGNKRDLYQPGDEERLTEYTRIHVSAETPTVLTEHGIIDIDLLHGATRSLRTGETHHHAHKPAERLSEAPIPDCGYLKAHNRGEGYESIGWRFSPEKSFNHDKLLAFLKGIDADRVKAVFITDSGVFGYNATSDALTETPLEDCPESRIEIIGAGLSDSLETELMSCLSDR
ncbi:CobW family GTP-binding protein [Marinobacter sp. F4216]|uniref:CobW family GTP-binding protein n=1 Tax=Marinobacter sp. F4216 TaxID=2874281 RepID=UPI001CBB33E0|nr:GTP-binding protein [Marinobacter sp. F4216]MBZ2168637.1 GTP-binding protein [Marinobacter sp. F4216]